MEGSLTFTLKIESQSLKDIATSLKEIVKIMAVTQAQIDELKATLGAKADQILDAIAAEKAQVDAAIDLLKTRVAELEAANNTTLDFSEVIGKFDQVSTSLGNIYEPAVTE